MAFTVYSTTQEGEGGGDAVDTSQNTFVVSVDMPTLIVHPVRTFTVTLDV